VFENRVLRRIFEPKRNEVMGEQRKLNNGKLCNLYSSPNIIRQVKIKENELGRVCGTHGRGEKCVRFRWENPKQRQHLEQTG
jgi:hypothetical protein